MSTARRLEKVAATVNADASAAERDASKLKENPSGSLTRNTY
jgi:hypothetical protein